jgi:glycosyltransferase involved in cell wall biosynthesis
LKKLISVILPVYNSEKYIFEAVQSILYQTYTNFELLILDDGSIDNTISIIENFNDERIILFKSEKNYGIVHQLNKGIDNCKGEFIARMDADDISHPERFEKQIIFFEDSRNSDIDVLGTDAMKIGDENGIFEFKNYKPKQISFLLNFNCAILHPSVMIRKRIFEKGLRYSENYKFAEDFALWKKIDNGSNISILPEILIDYRIHKSQTNKSSKRRNIQLKSVIEVAKLKSPNLIDNVLFNHKIKLKLINMGFGGNYIYKLSFYEKLFIRYQKKILGIKNHDLNMVIKGN